MRRARGLGLAIGGAWLGVAALAGAGESPWLTAATGAAQAAGLSGSWRAGYWSSSRTLDDREHLATTAAWLKLAPALGPALGLTAEGWLRSQDLGAGEAVEGALREAHVDLRLGALDLRLGKQIIVWGRADRINPTDNLTPRDFTLLVPDDDDQRLGVVAARATYYLGGAALSAIWLPVFEPHTLPVRRPAPPVTVRERAPDAPESQWAVRLERTGGAVDWSVSYVDGFDLSPDLVIDRAGATGVDLLLAYHRLRVVGADFAATLGRFGLRGEAAYTMTEDPDGHDPHVKNPFFFGVLGVERTFLEYLNVNVQWFVRVIRHHRSPRRITEPLARAVARQGAVASNQLDAVQHGVTLRVGHKWLNETLEVEVAGALGFTRGDHVVRPKITYALTDRWTIVAGADVFGGPRASSWGALSANTAAYLEVRRSF